MILLIWSLVFLGTVLWYCHQVYTRFTAFGLKQQRPFPFLGHLWRVIFHMDHLTATMNSMYKEFPKERFIGRFEFIKPCLFVRDITLVKKITIKDFDHFLDHGGFSDHNVEPLIGRTLISLRGQEWKDMRSTLSPAFTSSKIKQMIPFMEEVGEMMIRSIRNKIDSSGSNSVEIDCRDLTTRYTNDVIASCAFGLKVDSQTNTDNEFYKMGNKAITVTFWKIILFLMYTAIPLLGKIFKLKILPKETRTYFVDLVLNTMKERETRNIIRPDMIHLLKEAKKGGLSIENNGTNADDGSAIVKSDIRKTNKHKIWSDTDLVAQALQFLLAGFEVVSTAIIFTLYELALHPDVQERLAQEIKEHDEQCGGKLDLNSIQQLTYLDMVISEVLRLWAPVQVMERECTKDYNFGKPNSEATEDFILRKGEILNIPIWCIHRDPQFFPNPNKFDPERFSEENRHLINPLAYLPFGLGQRNCIGSRFSLCELKVLVYQVILNFHLSPAKNTCIPARLDKSFLHLKLEGGHALRFTSR